MSNVPSEKYYQDVPTDERKNPPAITRIIIAAIVLLVLLALIDWFYVNEHSERIRFITVNSLSLLVVVIIAIQSVIYRREWRVMQQGLRQTDRMIDKMHEQLDAMKSQGLLMDQSLLESQKLALQTEKMATFAQHQLEVMKLQGDAMTTQCEIMTHSLLATKQLVEQNERAVKATEDNAKTAREALYVGEAPYFGIIGMAFTDFELDRYPGIDIAFMNGGRTPAWHFHALLTLIVGNSPETGERFDMQTKATSPANNFYPSGDSKTLEYKQIGFAYTEERRRVITDQKALVFVEVLLSYQDRRKVRHNRTFHFAWHDSLKQFIDYEELFL